MQPTDKILGVAHDRLTKAGISPAIIQAIIMAITAILGACPAPTPNSVRNALTRPVIKLLMQRRLRQEGVPSSQIPATMAALEAMVGSASDEEVSVFIQAAQESM